MAPCEPRFLLESAGDESSPMMKTTPQRTRVELAILGEREWGDELGAFTQRKKLKVAI